MQYVLCSLLWMSEFTRREMIAMKHDTTLPRWRIALLSAFIVLNLSTVAFMNLPDILCKQMDKAFEAVLPSKPVYHLRYASWRWQQYAYITGLDNKWQMFGYQSRFNWWYDIRAIYSDGHVTKQLLLPLPNQSARSLGQQFLFDFKERKFELNIYLNEPARESYSHYLARQYPTFESLPIQSVRWHLGYQNILPPKEAVAKGQLHDPRCYVQLLNDFLIDDGNQLREGYTSPKASLPVGNVRLVKTEALLDPNPAVTESEENSK